MICEERREIGGREEGWTSARLPRGGVKCSRCGKQKDKNAATCLARDLECRKRRKKRHWERKCFSKAIREADDMEMNLKTFKALKESERCPSVP